MKVLLVALLLFAQSVFAAAPSDVSLREYTDVRFDAQDKAVSAALSAQEKAIAAALAAASAAVTKAEIATERRFENTNEWRNTVESLQKDFAPKDQLDALSKLVYVGLGILLAVQFLLGIAILLWKKK